MARPRKQTYTLEMYLKKYRVKKFVMMQTSREILCGKKNILMS